MWKLASMPLAQTFFEQYGNIILSAAGIFGGLLLLVLVLAFITYGKLWFQAYMSSADVSMLGLVGMHFRQVRPSIIVQAKIMASQAGLSKTKNTRHKTHMAHSIIQNTKHKT